MPTFWTLLRAGAVVVGSSAALLTGGIAHADPAPVPVPDIGQQLVGTAANAPQMLQSVASALGAQPPAPPPLASAGIQVPQPPTGSVPGASSVPGTGSLIPGANSLVSGATTPVSGTAPAAPGTTGIPGLTPAVPATAPATGPAQMMPQAQLNLPQVPFSPVPLPQHLSLPGDLASLAPGGVPVPRGIQQGTTAVSAPGTAAGTSSNPLLFPLSALP
ncbi:hypothetical protein [Mycobacterium celatum]|uniref:Uncharacterized protein n=1 Tax=Mycobacterium celatum TaxID=28045 RepID=A0A1X1RHQ0_MYCCE|nr:hypothetical protein [Mycobacterium celatum]ORV06412.1 hypothetical protein AWB95_22255 [Mycobacterium celatum]PIB78834.1 hypothetical protein CQY23_11810 [Mycobacterium celatum]